MQVYEYVILTIFVLLNTILGLGIYINNPKSSTNRLFAFLVLLLSFYLVVNSQIYAQQDFNIKLFLARAVMAVAAFINLAVYFFLVVFPDKKIPVGKYKIFFIWIVTLGLALISFTSLITNDIKVTSDNIITVVPGLLMPLFALQTGGLIIAGLVAIILRYRRSQGVDKKRIWFVFVAFFVLFLLILTFNYILPAFLGIGNFAPFLPFYILIFLFIVSYAIVKHRLLDIRLIVARAVTYIFLLLFIGFAYLAVLFNIAFFINKGKSPYSTLSDLIIPTIVAFLFALTFQPLRKLFEKVTDKVFYKDHYESNDLLWDLSRSMASTLGLDQLCKGVLNILLSTIKINYGAVILVRKDAVIWVSSAGSSSLKPLKSHELAKLIGLSYKPDKRNENLLIFDEIGESDMKQSMRDHGLTIVLPLIVRKELIGGLVLGEKSSGEIYSSEDINLLKILAPEIAVAVRNALSYEEIKKFNITLEQEVKKATEGLRKANYRLKELDILKDEFVSIASHELRTPMTAIKSYLWMAINKSPQKLDKQLKKYLDISYQSTERLIHLVNDMLTVSRIERNKIEIKKESFDISEILQLVYDELKITAQEKNIAFTLVKDKGDKYMVNGDKEKLREVFQNLVGNALKFTPKQGKITISINKDKNGVQISVSDTGSGILKEDQSKLFKKFSKIDYSYNKHSNQPGTGLGLYISKQIVSLHGGDIRVQSEVEKGSTFTVNLPQK